MCVQIQEQTTGVIQNGVKVYIDLLELGFALMSNQALVNEYWISSSEIKYTLSVTELEISSVNLRKRFYRAVNTIFLILIWATILVEAVFFRTHLEKTMANSGYATIATDVWLSILYFFLNIMFSVLLLLALNNLRSLLASFPDFKYNPIALSCLYMMIAILIIVPTLSLISYL